MWLGLQRRRLGAAPHLPQASRNSQGRSEMTLSHWLPQLSPESSLSSPPPSTHKQKFRMFVWPEEGY